MSECPNALLVRPAHIPAPPPVQQTPVTRREDTALSWSNTDKIEKFPEESKQSKGLMTSGGLEPEKIKTSGRSPLLKIRYM
jgi:hypothetical protein